METVANRYSYSTTQKLGEGTYGKVYRGTDHKSAKQVAVKVIRFTKPVVAKEEELLKREVEVMQTLSHPNIVTLLYYEKIKDIHYLVLELCQGGNLREYLDKASEKRLEEDVARYFLCQIASGLQIMQEHGFVHRDLKPQNILLSENSPSAVLKICDFGFARRTDPSDLMRTVLGSPLYMSPEVLLDQPYSSSVDLWSVGCIFYEMLVGSPYRADARSMDHLKQLSRDQRPVNFPNHLIISDEAKDLIKNLLKNKSHERLSWREFFDHHYLTPENLSKSTLELSFKDSTVSPTEVNQKKSTLPPQENTMLQAFRLIYPATFFFNLCVKPSLRIKDVKEILSNFVSIPASDQLMLSEENDDIRDDELLSSYGFNLRPKPIYLFDFKKLLAKEPRLDPKSAITVPHPRISGDDEQVVNQIYDNLDALCSIARTWHGHIKLNNSGFAVFVDLYLRKLRDLKPLEQSLTQNMHKIHKIRQEIINNKDRILSELSQKVTPMFDHGTLADKCGGLQTVQKVLENPVINSKDIEEKIRRYTEDIKKMQIISNGLTDLGAHPSQLTSYYNQIKQSRQTAIAICDKATPETLGVVIKQLNDILMGTTKHLNEFRQLENTFSQAVSKKMFSIASEIHKIELQCASISSLLNSVEEIKKSYENYKFLKGLPEAYSQILAEMNTRMKFKSKMVWEIGHTESKWKSEFDTESTRRKEFLTQNHPYVRLLAPQLNSSELPKFRIDRTEFDEQLPTISFDQIPADQTEIQRLRELNAELKSRLEKAEQTEIQPLREKNAELKSRLEKELNDRASLESECVLLRKAIEKLKSLKGN